MTKDGAGTGLIPGLDDLPEGPAGGAGKTAKGRSAAPAGKARKGARHPAAELPVARIAVDIPLPHLDRPFDYLVPADLDAKAVPGCRVRARFAGQLVDGFLLERVAESEFEGRLAYLERVVSPEAVLTPEVAALAREIADRYAGTFADVVRLAIPPRHARVEAEPTPATTPAAEPPAAGPVPSATREPAPPAAPAPDSAPPAALTPASEPLAAPEPGPPASPEAGSTPPTAPTPTAEPPAAPETEPSAAPAAELPAVGPVPSATREPAPPAAPAPGSAPQVAPAPGTELPAASVAEPSAGGSVPAAAPGPGLPAGPGAGSAPPTASTSASEPPARFATGSPAPAVPAAGAAAQAASAPGTEPSAGFVAGPERSATSESASPAEVAAEPPAAGSAPPAASQPGPPAGTVAGSAPVTASTPGSEPPAASGSEGPVAAATPPGGAVGGVVRPVVPVVSVAPGGVDVGRGGGAAGGGGTGAIGVSGASDSGPGSGGGSQRLSVGVWGEYPAGASFLGALAAGKAPRAVWTALPGPDWTAAIARAVAVVLGAGRGALVVMADGRDVARVDAALKAELGEGRHVALTAEQGPAERYRRWLAVLRGTVRAVVGTRAAMFAPVADLGLVVLWDDGDDVHAEPHAPYPHAREVLALRAHRTGAAALIGGFTRTTDATVLVETGWAHALAADRTRVRERMPRVRYAGEDAQLARDAAARTARLPGVAFEAARGALATGPVLVQVPRRGYVPGIACGRCRTQAQCAACQGPLALSSSHAAPYCRWCGRIAGDWHCPECGFFQVRAVVVGAKRTAEELGRAFPGVPVRTSGRDAVLDGVGGDRALVVATPGAEPPAEGGYAAALLLDGWVLLGRPDLRAGEEALRRWLNAAALVRPGGPVVVAAEGSLPAVQALVRWDPVTYAERELAERREVGFPPAARMASLTASPAAIRELLADARLPAGAEVLGPVPVPRAGPAEGPERERALVRAPRPAGAALARALKEAQGVRSARKADEAVRVQIDPLELI